MTVAQTIYQQIGGNKFALVTGCKNFTHDTNSLAMKLPKNNSGATHLLIELTGSDMYNMIFLKIKGVSIKTHKKIESVYSTQLNTVFEKETELYTKI